MIKAILFLSFVYIDGAVAQLGERSAGSAEVRGSIPLSSTIKKDRTVSFFFFYQEWGGDRNEDTTCVER